MAKLLHAPPAPGAIAAYVSDLSARLSQSAVGHDRAAEIIAEAEAHLRDHADALLSLGIDPSQAETAAVRDFQPASTFARDTARSTFEDSRSAVWCWAGAGVAGMFSLFVWVVLVAPAVLFLFLDSWTPIVTVTVLIVCCAFAARRAQTRRFTVWGGLAALVAFLMGGFYFLDGAPAGATQAGSEAWRASLWSMGTRESVDATHRLIQQEGRIRAAQSKILTLGIATYQSADHAIPACLRLGKGYVVPAPYNEKYHYGSSYVVPSPYGTGNAKGIITRPRPVATVAEARSLWRRDGREWLHRVEVCERDEMERDYQLRLALAQKGFRWKPAAFNGWQTLSMVLWVMFWDALAARIGQMVFLRRRARSRRLGRVQHG